MHFMPVRYLRLTSDTKRLFVLFLLFTGLASNSLLAYATEEPIPKVEVLDGYRLRLSLPTSARPETIWGLWEDVENWKQFDTLLEYSNLDVGDKFESGANGYIKARGASRTRFTLSDVVPGTRFTETLFVPLYQQIQLKREVRVIPASDSEESHSVFTHEVIFKGRLRFLIYAIAASSFKKELPLVMQRLRRVAQELEAAE